MMNTTHNAHLLTHLLLTLGLGLGFASAVTAQVYKTVDENGNVIYTDQPPAPGAQPIEMRGLSVVPTPEIRKKPVRANEGDANAEGEVVDLGALRRGYRDFRITQPMPDQSFVGTGNVATLAWDTRYELQPGMQVIFSINGQALPPTTAQVIATEPLNRGEHTVSAVLVDAKNRRIASAEPVSFFVRQWSQNFNRPGGG